MEPRKLNWEPRSKGAFGHYAVHAGLDSGCVLYVARASHNGGVIPGKLAVTHKCTYIPYDGREIAKSEYEVLTAPPGSLSWVECSNGNVPTSAVVGGRDPNGDKYFIGRVVHKNTVTVGKVHQRYGNCYIAYDGKEHTYKNYEILVRNMYGRHLNI